MDAVGAPGQILRSGVDQSLTPRRAPAPPFGTGASNIPDQRCYSSNTITTDRGATSHANGLKQASRKRQNAPSMLPRAADFFHCAGLPSSQPGSEGQRARPTGVSGLM